MGNKTISFGLSEREISRAIKEIQAFKQGIIQKTDILRQRIAEQIADRATSGFANAIVEDLLRGSPILAEVNVTVTEKDNVSLVIANGEDAVWVEFGAGVYHNGAAGSSPHSKGQELGFTIGGYGKGMGNRAVWGYYKEGELVLTHGTPAIMPMYNAAKEVCEGIADIVREVWR